MITRVTTVDEIAAQRINDLLNMLHPSPVSMNKERLNHLLKDEGFNLYLDINDDQTITGMLTMTRCRTLAGNKLWIEDVIVDKRFRGQGIGRGLIRAALDHARSSADASMIYLTSNPSRTSARKLYISEGFEEYETGVFRFGRLSRQ